MQFLSRGGTRQKEKKNNPYAVISVGIGRNKKSGLWGKRNSFQCSDSLIPSPTNNNPTPHQNLLQSLLLPLIVSGGMMLNSIRAPRQRSDILASMWDQIVWKCIILWGKWHSSMLEWCFSRCPIQNSKDIKKRVFRFISNSFLKILHTEKYSIKM